MKTVISLVLAIMWLAGPVNTQTLPDWSSVRTGFSASTQHQVIKFKIAEQTSFVINKLGHFVREGLNSRLVRYGTFGMMSIVGLCMLFSIGETESEGRTLKTSARRTCLSRTKRFIKAYRPSERKRWIRKVKGKFRRQVMLN